MRLYDHLFLKDDPSDVDPGNTFPDCINPESLIVVQGWIDPSLRALKAGERVQFERLGYFCADRDGNFDRPVFNRTVTLKDTWAKLEKKSAPGQG
jgi:glutaminyl-tRNA synthetase